MFALPAILGQSSGRSADNVFSYCPQDKTLLQLNRLVNGNFSYCPQDETLFQPPRLVNANFSYCPQDETLFPVHPPV